MPWWSCWRWESASSLRPSASATTAACAISGISPDAGMKPIAGYVIALLAGLILLAAIPWISIGFL